LNFPGTTQPRRLLTKPAAGGAIDFGNLVASIGMNIEMPQPAIFGFLILDCRTIIFGKGTRLAGARNR
jgi:hypothetical protein